MKIEELIRSYCAGNEIAVASGGSAAGIFKIGGVPVMELGRMKTDGFSEAQGLPEKLRRHAANDGLSVEAESSNVIPFGCEYRVKRQWKIAGNICEITCDVSADHGGRIRDLTLEDLRFPVKNARVEYLVYGEKEFRRDADYSGAEMLLMVRVTTPDGRKVEYYTGDDFWRHRAAAAIDGAGAKFELTITPDEVRYTRQVFSLPEEFIPEKRPWRFKSLIALSGPAVPAAAPAAEMNWDGCFASGAAHREFRSFIRRMPESSVAGLRGSFPSNCTDGSHQSRPGREVAHGDLAEVFNEWVWASGVLAKRGGSCVMHSSNELFAGSVILANMAAPLPQTTFGGEA